MMLNTLTPNARKLLETLQSGENIATPSPGIGAFAYSDRARAFLSNALTLCADSSSDFAVYGALYSLRHAVELWLKCLLRNNMMDVTLRTLMQPGLSFTQVADRLRMPKNDRPLLTQAVCALSTHLVSRMPAPDFHELDLASNDVEAALDHLRQQPSVPRELFAIAWTYTSSGHDLTQLWGRASSVLNEFYAAAIDYARRTALSPPLQPSEVEALVELLAALDDGGDGLRYPSSIRGAWYVRIPPLSLDSLGLLTRHLESTTIVFEGAREEAYEAATIGRPSPQLPW